MPHDTVLTVRIGDAYTDVDEFKQVWKQAEAGKTVTPSACLTFESMNGWLEALTPARWRLLSRLRKHGPLTQVWTLDKLVQTSGTVRRARARTRARFFSTTRYNTGWS